MASAKRLCQPRNLPRIIQANQLIFGRAFVRGRCICELCSTAHFEETLKDAINMCVKLGDSLGKACDPKWGGPLAGEDARFAAQTLAKMRNEKT